MPPQSLSKSLFVAGVQCHKLLWWKVHEPLATELQPDKVLLDRFDQGAQVGELARAEFAGGVLIDLKGSSIEGRVAATREAMEGGAPAVFEATVVADGVVVKVDVLLRDAERGTRDSTSWRLIEAKMTSSVKEEHFPDVAIQLHVLRRCGVNVSAVEVLHLNKEYHLPASGLRVVGGGDALFVRVDVTAQVTALLPTIPAQVAAQQKALEGQLPVVDIGLHCSNPRDCPFMERCWPQDPWHISKLYNVGPVKADKYMSAGVHSIRDIPPKQKLPDAAKRQIKAMTEQRMIVEPTLAAALAPFQVPRLGFLDFETIMRAVPVWADMKPHEQAPAQFSYHESRGDGTYAHVAYLAEGPKDCRPELVRLMLDATRGADRVVMYSSFEKTRIRALQENVPEFAGELKELEAKLIDLLPVMRDNVYHPDFQGSFSIKYVLKPMVPELSYSDLIIVDGLTASVEIARLLFVSGRIRPEEQARVRQDLLNYCERDTWAMVSLLQKLYALTA